MNLRSFQRKRKLKEHPVSKLLTDSRDDRDFLLHKFPVREFLKEPLPSSQPLQKTFLFQKKPFPLWPILNLLLEERFPQQANPKLE